jgi:hypothetical protein
MSEIYRRFLYFTLFLYFTDERYSAFSIHKPALNKRVIVKSGISSARTSQFILFAKKKASKLISDDILSSLESIDAPAEPAVDTSAVTANVMNKNAPKSNKNLSKFGLSEETISLLNEDLAEGSKQSSSSADAGLIPVGAENSSTSDSSKKAKKKRDKNKKAKGIGAFFLDQDEDKEDTSQSEAESTSDVEIDIDVNSNLNAKDDGHSNISDKSNYGDDNDDNNDDINDDTPVVVRNPDGLTAEQRIRKEKGSSRVRFAESSQPDFVMMELDKVGIVFGDDIIIKEASFSVKTGERLGLVGPNGGGKTSLLKTLAGVTEPTTGDVVKSSRNLRIAFLRQEFIDELVPTRSLKEELFSSFEEEQAILRDIAQCEAEVGLATGTT